MTLLTFNTMKDKLLNFEKQQTIRYNANFWVERLKTNPKLDIWWLNPRNKHPDCRQLGIAKGTIYDVVKGTDITNELAVADGFLNFNAFVIWFFENNPTIRSLEKFYDHEFAVIRWEWLETYWICESV